MMDFDRKSGNSSGGKAQKGRDPLLELTRLFGGKPDNATGNHDGDAVYEDEAGEEFPSGGFPALKVAYPSQGDFDDYSPYAPARTAERAEPGFLGDISGESYGSYPEQADLHEHASARVDYEGDSPAAGREEDNAGYYNDMPPEYFSAQGDRFSGPQTHEAGAHAADRDWHDTLQPDDEAAYFADGAAGYTNAEQWSHPAGWVPHQDEAPQDNGWREDAAAWGEGNADNQQPAQAYDGRGGFQQLPDEFFTSDTASPYNDAHYQAEEDIYPRADGQEPDRQAGAAVNPADDAFLYAGHMQAAGFEGLNHGPESQGRDNVQHPGDEIFDDRFFGVDMPQETVFEPADYESAYDDGSPLYNEPVLYPEDGAQAGQGMAFSGYEGQDVEAYDDETAPAFPPQTAAYDAQPFNSQEASQPVGAGRPGAYFGQGYSYTIHPIVHNRGVHEEEFSYQNVPAEPDPAIVDAPVYDGYSAEETETFIHGHDEDAPDARGTGAQYQRVRKALQDFDIANHSGGKQQYAQAPELASLELDEGGIEETGAFDLPPVTYDDAAAQKAHEGLDQEFADIFELNQQMEYASLSKNGSYQADEEDFFPGSVSGAAFRGRRDLPPEELVDDEENAGENAAYDWASPAALAAMTPREDERGLHGGRHRWLYGLVALAAFLALGSGAYILFFPGGENNSKPAIIRAEQGEVKVKPPNAGQPAASLQDQAVYNRVEGNMPGGVEQKKLIDKTETPVEIHKMDEQPPSATESGLNQSSVESFVRNAAARSMPIHIVPTVVVSPDRKIVTISEPSDKTTVLVPGGSQFAGSIDGNNADTQKTAAAHANMHQEPEAVAAAPAAGQGPAEKPIDIHEPETPVAAEGHVMASALNVPEAAKDIMPPSVIPDKPEVPVQLAGKTTEKTSARQVEAAQIQTVAEDNGVMPPNDFYVQISSQPSKEAAQQSAEEARLRFGSVIGNNNIMIVPAVIPERGTYYRVRVPVGERNAALRLCEQYKQAGGSCFIGR